MYRKWLIVWIGIFLSTYQGMAKGVELTKKVNFDIGKKSATLHGFVQGYNETDYTFYATKGEHLSVKLDATKVYFNIYSPNQSSSATSVFSGESEGDTYTGTIRNNGIYIIKLYLLSKDAKEDEKAVYTLHLNIN